MDIDKQTQVDIEWAIRTGCEMCWGDGLQGKVEWYNDLIPLMFIIESGHNPIGFGEISLPKKEFDSGLAKWVDSKNATEYMMVIDKAVNEMRPEYKGKKLCDGKVIGDLFYKIYKAHEKGETYFDSESVENLLSDIRQRERQLEEEQWGKS